MTTLSLLLSALPSIISVNSPTSAITTHYQYALHAGKVYWRSNPDYLKKCLCVGKAPVSWEEINIPVDEKSQEFISVAADDHVVLLQTKNKELWRFNTVDEKLDKEWGLPVPKKLIGLKLQQKLKVPDYVSELIYSIRHKDVGYYEDTLGNQFHWGSAGCTTVLTLNKDQQTISWGDPWFPPDLSRQICGPNRGKKKLINIASSASVTLALASDGSIYTRFYDYDSNGGTPFFTYAYQSAPLHGRAGSDRNSEFMTRALPAEEWSTQPSIPMIGKTKLSKRMAVLQTGLGNSARELRILGKNAEGKNGYFYKSLTESNWNFSITDEFIEESLFVNLDPIGKDYSNHDLSFSGRMLKKKFNGPHEIIAYIDSQDMNMHCTPISFQFTLSNGERFKLLAHTVDAWTPYQSDDPQKSPNSKKMLKITWEIPTETQNHSSDDIQDFIKRYFSRDHLKAFRWVMVMDQNKAHLRRASYPLKMKLQSTDELTIDLGSKLKKSNPKKSQISLNELKLRENFINKIQSLLPLPLTMVDALSVLTTVRYTVPAMRGVPSFQSHIASILLANEIDINWMYQEGNYVIDPHLSHED